MCGIIAIMRRPSQRPSPSREALIELLNLAEAAFDPNSAESLAQSTVHLNELKALISAEPGARFLLAESEIADEIATRVSKLQRLLQTEVEASQSSAQQDNEQLNAARIAMKDAMWSILQDRLAVVASLQELCGTNTNAASVSAMLSVHDALRSLDRLEVRGRDSAGLHLFVSCDEADLQAPAIQAELEQRCENRAFTNLAVRNFGNLVSFVYKTAEEIGELGDNTAALRDAIKNDRLLAHLLSNDSARCQVLGHTRWASIGIISEPNAHPINSDLAHTTSNAPGATAISGEVTAETAGACAQLHKAKADDYFVASLNGDVDNHHDLMSQAGLVFDTAITTDAKVIPTLVADGIDSGQSLDEAFRSSVDSFDGSVAIALTGKKDPNLLHLAQRGSGQALYVGLSEDTFIVASEPYGLVELTCDYIRLDGETPVDEHDPSSARGQIVKLDARHAGKLEGIQRFSYDGRELPLSESEVAVASITTRDIDRAGFDHFLLKEINEAPVSFRKTLAGKLIHSAEGLTVNLTEESLPQNLRDRLKNNEIKRIVAIGQGTAAIAARAFAEALQPQVEGKLSVQATLSSELSGFGLHNDMADTLVVAVSQSGTTTDTNRTVDIVRRQGAAVLAIVNRRDSDLTEKADGVLYTSDGRDVEMSVASTKAFYSQVAAGFLLASKIAEQIGRSESANNATKRILAGLLELPEAMEQVIKSRDEIARVAQDVVPSKRYWAIVGSGPNRVAAEEIRIKLSELCYRAIACDSIEDKKHIDLSSEPLIVVCAAGLSGGTADDAAKEVKIFNAHKATPVVIASNGEARFEGAHIIRVPHVEPELGFVLSAVAGHLFGYEAALAIDESAMPLRRLRAAIAGAIEQTPDASGSELMRRLQPVMQLTRKEFKAGLRSGLYDGNMESSTAAELSLLLRYGSGVGSFGEYQLDFAKVGTPAVVLEDLGVTLAEAIDELTRPIDAIKHQAKTVTVGISRNDETMLQVPLIKEVLDFGAPRDSLSYQTLKSLAAISPIVEQILGHTRYRIDGDPGEADCSISVVGRSGVSEGLISRVDRDSVLRGTKHRVATDQKLLLTKGRWDQRVIILIPEIIDARCGAITLLHTELSNELRAEQIKHALENYHNRYIRIRDAVLETEPNFDVADLTKIKAVQLFANAPSEIADEIKALKESQNS